MSGLETSMKKILLILICGQLVFSCNKDNISDSCKSLKDGVLNNQVDKVRVVITNFINELPGRIYNDANLTSLAQKISSQCNISCTVLCFDCIKTLPSQSEIRITINSGGTTVARTIDIDYSSSNIMTFRNMHD